MGKNNQTNSKMLQQIIVIDYIEGAGGEYLSNFLNAHAEFYNRGIILDNLQQSNDMIQKFFNTKSITCLNWNMNFVEYLKEYENLCKEQKISKVVVPYHLYKFPKHVDLFSLIAKDVRFVKIDSTGYEYLITYDFVKKILLQKVLKHNLQQLSLLIKNYSVKEKQKLINLLKTEDLFLVDVFDTDNISRQAKIKKYFQAACTKILPSDDITVNYKDFFIDLSKVQDNYKFVCEVLQIEQDNALLDQLITRNTKNYQSLLSYIEKNKL